MSWKVRKRKTNTIILGYYGIGKSYLAEHDNTVYDWTYTLMQPKLEELEYGLENYDTILCDPNCQDILDKGDFKYHIVIPDPKLKDEYLERFKARYEAKKGAGGQGFCRGMANRWDTAIERLRNTPCLSLTILNKGQYLADVIDDIL